MCSCDRPGSFCGHAADDPSETRYVVSGTLISDVIGDVVSDVTGDVVIGAG